MRIVGWAFTWAESGAPMGPETDLRNRRTDISANAFPPMEKMSDEGPPMR
jgi:hypothetical protein